MERTQQELKQRIDNEIEKGENLPSFSTASQKALALLKLENVGIQELAQSILRDPGMTAAILRVVNSTYYALPRNISRVPEAISYIGLEETKHIIYVSFARNLFGAGMSGKSWRHAVASAFIAEGIALHSGLDGDESYIAALLHDIGKTFLQTKIAPRYYSIMSALENVDKDSVILAEQRVFGYDHAEIGERLLRRWNFDERLVRAIGLHHQAQQPNEPLCQVVALANQVAHQIEVPTPSKSTIVNPATLTQIKIDREGSTSVFEISKEMLDSFLDKVSILT